MVSLQLVYALILVSFIGSPILSFIRGEEVDMSKLATGIWVGQAGFYAISNFKLRDDVYRIRKLNLIVNYNSKTVKETNDLLLSRLATLSPSVLREIGLSVKKVV